MGRKASTAAIVLAALLWGCAGHKPEGKNVANLPEKEIRDLSYAIKAAPSYRADMRRQLDSIEVCLAQASTDEEKCELNLALAQRFRPTNTDSSLYYAHTARVLAERLGEREIQRADIATIDALSTAGLFTEATEMLNSLGRRPMSREIKLDYWVAGRRLYGYMRGYAKGSQECYTKYDALYQQYDDSLLQNLPRHLPLLKFLECERMVSRKRYHEAQESLEKLMAELPEEANLYGMAAYQMAEVWLNLGDESKSAAYLAMSAQSDVKGCVTEGMALPALANWLYEKGELSESFSFINFALEEASAGNARMRAVSIAQFVPLIDDAYNQKINSSRDELMVYFILVTILLIITGVLIVFLVKQMKRSNAGARKLAQTSKRQESYIANFIGLYASYADRLNNLTRIVSAKLAAGQAAELKKLVDSGKFTDQDNDDIHKIFDAAFLDIYPDFVASVNSLLRPEETLKEGVGLTPELRIYAFVKLGIEESTRIAQILHYSVNTVYAYRNKMRNKALQRDTFDSDIKRL